MLVDGGINLNIHVTKQNILLILRDCTDQTVVENWRLSRKKTILFVTSVVLTDIQNLRTSQGGMRLRKMTNSSIVWSR